MKILVPPVLTVLLYRCQCFELQVYLFVVIYSLWISLENKFLKDKYETGNKNFHRIDIKSFSIQLYGFTTNVSSRTIIRNYSCFLTYNPQRSKLFDLYTDFSNNRQKMYTCHLKDDSGKAIKQDDAFAIRPAVNHYSIKKRSPQ